MQLHDLQQLPGQHWLVFHDLFRAQLSLPIHLPGIRIITLTAALTAAVAASAVAAAAIAVSTTVAATLLASLTTNAVAARR